jgi:hypothetical protein
VDLVDMAAECSEYGAMRMGKDVVSMRVWTLFLCV